jgi:hypothetical protein
MKSGVVTAGIILVVIIASTYFYLAGKEYVFRFSETEIQNTLQKGLPLTKTYLLIIQVTLKHPRVELENGSDRVNAGLDVELNLTIGETSEPLGGSIDVSGGVRYDPEAGQFFLTDPNIEQLQVQGIPAPYIEKANSALTKALAQFYAERPIYTLKRSDAKQLAAKMVLKSVVVENQELVITLGV